MEDQSYLSLVYLGSKCCWQWRTTLHILSSSLHTNRHGIRDLHDSIVIAVVFPDLNNNAIIINGCQYNILQSPIQCIVMIVRQTNVIDQCCSTIYWYDCQTTNAIHQYNILAWLLDKAMQYNINNQLTWIVTPHYWMCTFHTEWRYYCTKCCCTTL